MPALGSNKLREDKPVGADEEEFRHEDLPNEAQQLVRLPKLPASMSYPASATTKNAQDRFRLALANSMTYFPGNADVWERASRWLYESPLFYRSNVSHEVNARSLNIRKNKAAKSPEHYLVDRRFEINPKMLPADAKWGAWITIENDVATFVEKFRFEHEYLVPFHFVHFLEVRVPNYEATYIEDWMKKDRPERIHPAQVNLQTHRRAVAEAIERDFLHPTELQQYQALKQLNSAKDPYDQTKESMNDVLNFLEREVQFELFRSLGPTKLKDLIPPRQPEVFWEKTRNEITIGGQGVINLGPFARDLQQLPTELVEGNTCGEAFGDWFSSELF